MYTRCAHGIQTPASYDISFLQKAEADEEVPNNAEPTLNNFILGRQFEFK